LNAGDSRERWKRGKEKKKKKRREISLSNLSHTPAAHSIGKEKKGEGGKVVIFI